MRPLQKSPKKAGVYAAVLGVHRPSGGAGEQSRHPLYKEATGSTDATCMWTGAISRSLNPLPVIKAHSA